MSYLKFIPGFILLFTASLIATGQTRAIDKDFLDAIQNRDAKKAQELLSRGANINTQEPTNGHFALQYAINWPDAGLVKMLVERGADVNLADTSGYTALIDAVRDNKPEYTTIAKFLIEHGANVHSSNDEAIFAAARGADHEVVQLLIGKGAPVNLHDAKNDGDTVLMTAAGGASVETIKLLVAAGADIKATNNENESALMKAVTLDHRYSPEVRLPIIDFLLNGGSDLNGVDKSGRTPLLHAVVQYMSEAGGVISHPEVVKLLLDRGADVKLRDNEGNTALLLAIEVRNESPDIVRLLLGHGVEINAQNSKGESALMVAAERRESEMVQLLIDRGADLSLKDVKDATALDFAVKQGRIDVARLLFAKGARSSGRYETEEALTKATTNFALLRAATANDLATARKTLDAGANVNTRNQNAETPLILAVEFGYSLDIATLLIDKGADVDAVNASGETALMLAAARNNSDAAKLLVAHKASLSPRNKKQQTALHIAAAALSAAIVKSILGDQAVNKNKASVKRVEVDTRDENGRTALLLAADNEGMVPDEVFDLLLNAGAKLNAQDNEGNTALMLSTRAGGFSGVEFLLAKHADLNVRNKAGLTALAIAHTIHNNQRIMNANLVEARVVSMLSKAGAKE